MKSCKRVDLAIVGAGPAGCTAAYTAAKAGMRVCLVERCALPRYKSCSGMLIAKAIQRIRAYYGQDAPVATTCCAPIRNAGMVFTDECGKEYRFESAGLNVWRSELDAWFAAQARAQEAQILEQTPVARCVPTQSGVELTTARGDRIEARRAILATGVSALGGQASYIYTYQTYCEGTVRLDPHYFYAYLQPEFSDYDAWLNVKDGQIVFGVASPSKARLAAYHERFAEYLRERHGLRVTKTLRVDAWAMRRIAPGCATNYGDGRMLYAGEAAGLLNPMGEGVSCALESGYAAARAVMTGGDDAQVADAYRERLQDTVAYMRRQWHLTGRLSERFAAMQL